MSGATESTVPAAPGGAASNTLRHVFLVWIAIIALLAWGGVIAILAIGGRPDPAALRAAAPLLGGAWRFQLGDDPRWARANFDDSDWETVDLSAPASSHDGDVGLPNYVGGWMVHGHPGYQGYAWYRRAVTVPAGNRAWDVLGPPLVDDSYELYWNGVRLGGSGRLGPSPRVVGTRPMIFALPADVAGTRGVLALRTFMQPGGDANPDGGGVHIAPTLAPRPQSDQLYRVQWWRTIAGYIVDAVEPLAMVTLIGLALALRRRGRYGRFLAFVCLALALSAVKRLDNALVSWTDLMSLPTYTWLSNVLWMPLGLAAWAHAWNHWHPRASRGIDGAIVLLTLVGLAAGLMHAGAVTHLFRLGLLALFVLMAARMVRGSSMRPLALSTMALIVISQYAPELGAIGVPTIGFPFGIGVTLTQYAYAIGLPLLACLVACMTPKYAADSCSLQSYGDLGRLVDGPLR